MGIFLDLNGNTSSIEEGALKNKLVLPKDLIDFKAQMKAVKMNVPVGGAMAGRRIPTGVAFSKIKNAITTASGTILCATYTGSTKRGCDEFLCFIISYKNYIIKLDYTIGSGTLLYLTSMKVLAGPTYATGGLTKSEITFILKEINGLQFASISIDNDSIFAMTQLGISINRQAAESLGNKVKKFDMVVVLDKNAHNMLITKVKK